MVFFLTLSDFCTLYSMHLSDQKLYKANMLITFMKSDRFLEDEYLTHLFAVAEMLWIGVGLLLKTL